jgi:hypothetical protein
VAVEAVPQADGGDDRVALGGHLQVVGGSSQGFEHQFASSQAVVTERTRKPLQTLSSW